ncbi:hypothetical protein GCM10007908_20680 [Rhizobium albus]|nr:hypothetical protein GCM10007908_20680 [Rhizobium albus]
MEELAESERIGKGYDRHMAAKSGFSFCLRQKVGQDPGGHHAWPLIGVETTLYMHMRPGCGIAEAQIEHFMAATRPATGKGETLFKHGHFEFRFAAQRR